MRFLKPIDEKILNAVGQKFKRIVTIEDGALKGGLGSAVLEYMADHHLHPDVVRLVYQTTSWNTAAWRNCIIWRASTKKQS